MLKRQRPKIKSTSSIQNSKILLPIIAIIPPLCVAIFSLITGLLNVKLQEEKQNFTIRSTYIEKALDETRTIASRKLLLRFISDIENGVLAQWAKNELDRIKDYEKSRIDSLENMISLLRISHDKLNLKLLDMHNKYVASPPKRNNQNLVIEQSIADSVLKYLDIQGEITSCCWDIDFDRNTKQILPKSYPALKKIGWIIENNNISVMIYVFVHPKYKPENHNMIWSKEMVEELIKFFISYGIDPKQVNESHSYGSIGFIQDSLRPFQTQINVMF